MDESAARPEEQIDGRTVSGPKHPHDSHGHFIHKFPTPPKPGSQPSLTEKLFPTHVSVDHKVTQDALLDVHIGNPLRRITQLLEEIKRQKAFSFTLKGSLGIMGVALALSVFGFLVVPKSSVTKARRRYPARSNLSQSWIAPLRFPFFLQLLTLPIIYCFTKAGRQGPSAMFSLI